ncbi:MAG: hypothetical protein J5817_00695, partial [Treponema sp.]|nr:hypothetical protein [Treponema sp.]
KDKDTIYTRTDKDVARYTVASAKYISDHELVCPSCGATQTKEQLLDGCDYCGTKFMIEDLEEKISDFALRSDYELQYERYKEARSNFTPKVFIYTDLFWVVLYTIYTLFNFSKFRAETGFGVVSTVVCVPILMIFFAMPFAAIAVGIFNAFIFPFVQIGATLRYASKKVLDKQRQAEAGNKKMQDIVKKCDPYFSISSFYSNVQNKLATVHFAESSDQINAFSLCDLSSYREKYKGVIDMNVEYIRLKDYTVSGGLQKARVETAVKLVSYNGRKCSVEKESISMLFTKSAECKTQIVCAPAVMRCKGCGASLSFLEGKKCKFCGKEMDLENHDWVIREYCNFEL